MHKRNFTPDEELGAAIWLVRNTSMRPADIAAILPRIHEFQVILVKSETCNLDVDEFNPIEEGMLAEDEIKSIVARYYNKPIPRKVKRYIPKILRDQVPGVIVWLYQNYPTLSVREISYSLGTTTKRVKDLQNTPDIDPIHPVRCEVLTNTALNELLEHVK